MAATATAAVAKAARERLSPPLSERRAEWDCLLIAAQKGNAAFLKQILSDHPEAMAHSTPLGQTALHIAAWWGRTSCLRILLEHEQEQLEQQQHSSTSASASASTNTSNTDPSSGSLVHKKGRSGATPLHECLASSAVRRSQSQRLRRRLCFEALLDAGADPNSRDAHQKTPLDRLVVASASPLASPLASPSPEDASDRAFLEQLISDRERSLPVKRVLKQLESTWSTLEDVERMWRGAVALKPVVPSLSSSLSSSADTRTTMMMMVGKLLSEAFAAKIGAWTMDPEEDISLSQTTNGEPGKPMDHEWWSERIAWMWKKLVEISESHEGNENDNDNNNNNNNDNNDENDNNNDNDNDHGQESGKNASSRGCNLPQEPIGQNKQKALVTALATAIFRRYEHLCRTSPRPESSPPSRSRLRDDAALRCWTATMKLLLEQRNPESSLCSTATYDGDDDDDENALSKAWISIGRRDYSELAELWWDTLGIAPTSIGIANRQGMTPLHFAARSGHREMVQWMLGHGHANGRANRRAGRSDFETTKEWVLRTDRHGQTAFDAATANGHESVARLLREFELESEL